jgi:Bacteriophage tail sheath protein
MPVTPTYPGIYIQEAPSSVHSITPAPTNIAVFMGYTHPFKTNPANFGQAVQIFGFADYQRGFGGFLRSTAYAIAGAAQYMEGGKPQYAVSASAPEASFGDMASAVNQFFLNGGTQAYVVGLLPSFLNNVWIGDAVSPPGSTGPQIVTGPTGGITAVTGASLDVGGVVFTALEVTDENFVMNLTVRLIRPATSLPAEPQADVIITYGPSSQPGGQVPSGQLPSGTVTETYRRVTLDPTDPNYILTRIGTADSPVSALVTVALGSPAPAAFKETSQEGFPVALPTGDAASLFAADDFTTAMEQDHSLDKVQVFNLMSIPGVSNSSVLSAAEAFCERKFAFLIVDPPLTDSADGTLPHFPRTIGDTIAGNNVDASGVPITIPESKNSALYFPYLLSPDPLTGQSINLVTGAVNEIPPGTTVAGVYAATDLARGVWKAPAGFQASAVNTTGVAARGSMTDQRQGLLNPAGVNCLRTFPNIPTPVVFGARTLVTLTDEQWRYVPVRRMALFLEQTLYANLKWVIFEPNASPLWSAITMSINAFMLGLFKQQAFQGDTPSQAFFVLCNSQTTTQTDIDNGIVNIVVGFAPLKPAEFVVVTIAQIAGQTQTS